MQGEGYLTFLVPLNAFLWGTSPGPWSGGLGGCRRFPCAPASFRDGRDTDPASGCLCSKEVGGPRLSSLPAMLLSLHEPQRES